MRTLFTALLFIAMSIQLSKQSKETPVTIIPTYRYTIEDVIDNCSSQEFKDKYILKQLPQISPKVVVKLSPLAPHIGGITTQIDEHIYFIQINPMFDLQTSQRTYFHELVHVYQFDNGILTDGPIPTWRGWPYSWAIPWQYRPWEIHAEALTDSLFVY